MRVSHLECLHSKLIVISYIYIYISPTPGAFGSGHLCPNCGSIKPNRSPTPLFSSTTCSRTTCLYGSWRFAPWWQHCELYKGPTSGSHDQGGLHMDLLNWLALFFDFHPRMDSGAALAPLRRWFFFFLIIIIIFVKCFGKKDNLELFDNL